MKTQYLFHFFLGVIATFSNMNAYISLTTDKTHQYINYKTPSPTQVALGGIWKPFEEKVVKPFEEKVIKPVGEIIKPVGEAIKPIIGKIEPWAQEGIEWIKKGIKIGVKEAQNLAKKLVEATYPTVTKNPYKRKPASVRVGAQHSIQEKMYLSRRMPHVKAALEKFLGRTINPKQVPKIALVSGDTGYRGMIATVGSLVAADDIGLLDATTWFATSSGATWALSAWIEKNISTESFKRDLAKKVEKGLEEIPFTTPEGLWEIKLLLDQLLVKFAFDQKITVIDLFGGLLANRLLSHRRNNRHSTYLSNQAKRMQDGKTVFPIHTAIAEGRWYDFTPYEVGSEAYGLHIPTWGIGRKFSQGQSVDFAPEQSLGFLWGLFGCSAVTPSVARFMISTLDKGIEAAIDNIPETDPQQIITRLILKVIHTEIIRKQIFNNLENLVARDLSHWAKGEIHNFTKGLAYSPIRNYNTIKLHDSVMDMGLPYPAISGEKEDRKADIIILFDYAEGTENMKKIEKYALSTNIKLPKIDYTNLDKKAITVFKDEKNPKASVIIYMPLVKDQEMWLNYKKNQEFFGPYEDYLENFDPIQCMRKGFCKSGNIKYSSDEFEKLSLQTEFNLKASKKIIAEAINWVIDKKAQ